MGIVFLRNAAVAVFCLQFLTVQAFAANVSFLVMEREIQEDSERSPLADLWENAILEAFFDAGHVVSNAPSLRYRGEIPAEGIPLGARPGWEQAKGAGMDFFLLVLSDTPLREVTVRVFDIRSGQMLAEKVLASGAAWDGREGKEEMKSLATSMAALVGETGGGA